MADIPETNNSVELTHNTQSSTPLTSVSSGDNLSGYHLEPDKLGGEKRNGTRYIKPTTPTARDRWGRLKSTMAATSGMAKKKSGLDRGDSFLRKFSTRNQAEETVTIESEEDKTHTDRSYSKHRTCSSYVIHPSGGLMFYWLGVVTLSVLYNLWTCIAREAFREIQDGYMIVWFSLDAFSDFIYVCDIFVQFRTGYLQQGLMVYDSKKLCINYMKSKPFIIDLLCLLPLDFVQFYTGIHAMLRFPRFIKIYRSVRFMHMYESRTAYPNLLRVLNLSHILFLGSHWFAAFYYLISEAEGFEGGWSYPEPKGMYAAVTRKYLASLYWSTLTLTTIGDLPPPDTNWQYVFVIVSYLIGVFIFATIVGQVGNVITNRNASRQEFERLLDGAKFYMQMHNVPPDLQKRVQRWYDYVWTRGRLNCNDINSLGLLPDKLKTELALHVNLGTLRKVTIFQKCRPEFLHDLMLKMRAYIFTPGDLICRRGEVAREMFIIADGVVEILGENATVLTQMSTGDFFGEIGILNLDGGINRRTADVRSVGYSELFVLSREDVLAALKDHPDAEQIIREYGQRRLRETEEHRKMIRSAPCSPDPSSAWKGSKMQNKNTQNTEHSNLLHLPQVKCFQNLQMSPKLRKVFHLRQKRSKSKVNDKFASEEKITCDPQKTGSFKKETTAAERRRSFQMDHNKTYPMQSLDVIQEKDHSDVSDCDHSDRETKDTGPGNFNLARAVLNLIRSQKQAEYMAIHGDEASDANKTSGNSDMKTGSRNLQKSQSETSSDAGQRREQNQNQNGGDGGGSKIVGMRKYHSADSKNKKPPLPKIVLTDEKRQISSTSSSDDDSEDDDDDDAQTPTSSTIPIRPSARDSIGRKSSPCVLTLPSSFHDRMNRRISLPPPLDLPIEVPNFSNFHGLTRNSTDVSHTIDRFKDTMERRMDDLENSYKETISKLEETTRNQERFMRTIIKRLSVGKGKSLRHRAEGRASIIKESDDVVPLSQTELESNENTDSVETTKESANVDIDIQTIEQQTKSAASEQCQDVADPDAECCDPDAPCCDPDGQTCDPETELYNPDAPCDDPDEQSGDPEAPDGSGSSTEETLSKEKYANNPSVDYLRTSSLDSSRQSSTDSLPYSMNGIRKLDPFQLVEEKHSETSDVTDKLEHQFDEVRVTHL